MIRIITLLFLAIGTLPLSAATPPAPVPLTAAVLNFEVVSGITPEQGKEIAILLEPVLQANPRLILVERAMLDQVLSEQELTLSGTVSTETAAKVGRLTGAKILIIGRIVPAETSQILIAKAIGTETGRVFTKSARFSNPQGLDSAVKELGKSLGETIVENQNQLLAKLETPENRIAKLRAKVKGRTALPSVFISIPDEHLSRHLADPAAESEIQLTLQTLGFPMVQTADKADWSVTGTAFSERGAIRGQLVSCRARVEIKIRRFGSDQFKVDRQTAVAVDVAEHVAAKSALAEAGRMLADRIVDQLLAARR